jgi:hypothetical protein
LSGAVRRSHTDRVKGRLEQRPESVMQRTGICGRILRFVSGTAGSEPTQSDGGACTAESSAVPRCRKTARVAGRETMSESKNPVRMLMLGIATAAMLAVFVGLPAAAQSTHQKVDVPFDFVAAGHDLSAGSYRVKMGKDSAGHVELVLVSKDEETRLPVMTRLATLGRSVTSAKLVLDKADGKYTLSEVWLPDFDGFLISGAEVEHAHLIVGEENVN